MSSRRFNKCVLRLAAGVTCGFGRKHHLQPATFRLEIRDGKFRGVMTDSDMGRVITVWESRSLQLLQKIATSYCRGLAKHFGPARQYAGL